MTIIRFCPRCKGEGRKTDPPFIPEGSINIDKPIVWREDKPCFQCKGVGYLGLNYNVLKEHLSYVIV